MGKKPARITINRAREGLRVTASNRNDRGVYYRGRTILIGSKGWGKAQEKAALKAAIESLMTPLTPTPQD